MLKNHLARHMMRRKDDFRQKSHPRMIREGFFGSVICAGDFPAGFTGVVLEIARSSYVSNLISLSAISRLISAKNIAAGVLLRPLAMLLIVSFHLNFVPRFLLFFSDGAEVRLSNDSLDILFSITKMLHVMHQRGSSVKVK